MSSSTHGRDYVWQTSIAIIWKRLTFFPIMDAHDAAEQVVDADVAATQHTHLVGDALLGRVVQ